MKPKTKTILFILLSFALGVLFGWLTSRHSTILPGKTKIDFTKILKEKLELDSVQVLKVDSILESRKEDFEALKKRFHALGDTIRMEIRKLLNEKQAKRFDDWNRELDKKDPSKNKSD